MNPVDRFGVPDPMPAVCPVSGLPIHTRPEWIYTSPGRTYRTTIALIGESIFWVVPSGYVTEADMVAATAVASDVLSEVHPRQTPFVFIEDFSHTCGGTAAARRLYLRYTNSLPGLLGSFPYGLPAFFRFSFNFSRRLYLHRYNVRMMASYEDAVHAALEKLAQHGVFPGTSRPFEAAHRRKGMPPEASARKVEERCFSTAGQRRVKRHVEDLLAYLGSLDLQSLDIPEPPPCARKSSLAPVYEALSMMKLDMDQYLAEHLDLVASLQERHSELVEKTAALEAHNRELQVLLQQSAEDQAALGRTVRHNVETLLKPILQRVEHEDGTGFLREGSLGRINADVDDLTRDLHPPLNLHDYRLTAQELRIARMIRDGARSKEIARRLGLSVRTVEVFRGRLRDKLGIQGLARNLRTLLQTIPDA